MMDPGGIDSQNDRSGVKREKIAEAFNNSDPNMSYEIKIQHQDRYRCDICDLTFEGLEYLMLHKKFHVGEKDAMPEQQSAKEAPKKRRKYKCDQCDVKVNSQYHLDIHRSKHEGSAARKFICEICDRSFVAAQFLKSHMQSHSSNSNIHCEICEKTFTGQAYLKLHMQLHNDVKKFKCTKCEETLPTKNCLKIHMKKHTKVKNYKCEYCGKLFVSRITMEKHKQTHEGQTVDCHVKCNQCDRTMHASLIRTHVQRVHSTTMDDDVKRPHKCLTCGKNFIVKINLNLHIRVCHPDLAEPEDEDDDIQSD